jgi:D-alanyl-lipoteichoic acid acyltransferase DltB (MBOAT superfamily)
MANSPGGSTVLFIIISNTLPLCGILFWGWSTVEILLWFLLEAVGTIVLDYIEGGIYKYKTGTSERIGIPALAWLYKEQVFLGGFLVLLPFLLTIWWLVVSVSTGHIADMIAEIMFLLSAVLLVRFLLEYIGTKGFRETSMDSIFRESAERFLIMLIVGYAAIELNTNTGEQFGLSLVVLIVLVKMVIELTLAARDRQKTVPVARTESMI